MRVEMRVYYRGDKGRLHQINVFWPMYEVGHVRETVIQDLKDNMEPCTSPVLVLLKGGKA